MLRYTKLARNYAAADSPVETQRDRNTRCYILHRPVFQILLSLVLISNCAIETRV